MADHIASELLEELPAALGDLIAAIGRGVADAQGALDAAAIEQLSAIATADGRVAETLRAIGYQPTWYRIPELQAELAVSLTLAGRSERSGRAAMQLYATPIDASFSNKYFVNAEVTSRISFKVVPVPPSPLAAGLVVVPDLLEPALTWAEATALLEASAIPFERDAVDLREVADDEPGREGLLADSDPVVATTPGPHEVLLPGATLVVTTRRPGSVA